MSPQKYLFHVNSGAAAVSDDLWREFYISEHLPDIVNSGCAVRATLYEELPTPFNTSLNHPRNFLALYQTQYPELLKAECHQKVRVTSELFAKEDSGTNLIMENGDFAGRNYEFIQEFDPFGIGETPPPQMLTVEMNPENVEDFEKWYREEHLNMLQKLQGYRRSLRYKLGLDSGVARGDFQPSRLAIHEVDDVDAAFGGKEAEAANTTPWTLKHVKDSKVFVARGWKLIHALGY